uniref:Apolipoprotein C-I n=2 Tax=Xenopus tropicalis TaxID=8364 RepID=A0A6I8R0U8_XENTR
MGTRRCPFFCTEKMKLLLAISVILVTICVLTECKPSEADSESKSFRDHFDSAGTAIKDFGAKTKDFFKDLHNSEAMTKTRNWFTDLYKKIKEKTTGSD